MHLIKVDVLMGELLYYFLLLSEGDEILLSYYVTRVAFRLWTEGKVVVNATI